MAKQAPLSLLHHFVLLTCFSCQLLFFFKGPKRWYLIRSSIRSHFWARIKNYLGTNTWSNPGHGSQIDSYPPLPIIPFPSQIPVQVPRVVPGKQIITVVHWVDSFFFLTRRVKGECGSGLRPCTKTKAQSWEVRNGESWWGFYNFYYCPWIISRTNTLSSCKGSHA